MEACNLMGDLSSFRLVPERRPTAEEVLGSESLRETVAAEEAEPRECVVCLDGEPTFAVSPCGHRCLCAGCLGAAAQECPLCRTPSEGTMRIYE